MPGTLRRKRLSIFAVRIKARLNSGAE